MNSVLTHFDVAELSKVKHPT